MDKLVSKQNFPRKKAQELSISFGMYFLGEGSIATTRLG